ncbi:respiratory nitrate reductase subunit gamma [Promicromonospora iranensis]|jgi:nitrate reductase gamma subunit|uniref:respiratory nitrate reductase subunit gamma n=1 Tax=Promicromonospora iranensis TaxID=1105144 RepID=UPI0023A9B843|nr:respiratory nitrate reductase subunit gamma [Promicromonospora iranensis]
MDVMLWVVLPYVTFAVLVVGSVWRYRYDKFGWTTRSSQLYESRLLRLGSPLFHLGLLVVILGHVAGLAIPETWTAAVGIPEGVYHLVAALAGAAASAVLVLGLLILIYRRRVTSAVFLATTVMDKVMYAMLGLSVLSGAWATATTQLLTAHGYDYRQTISPWFRSLWYLQPQPELMVGVPVAFQVHVVAAFLLFALWPFTRLVHAFSAPVGYLFRPYVVYRSRDDARSGAASGGSGSHRPRPGWEPSTDPRKRS